MNLRADPTRTTLIRRQFMADVQRRMQALNKAVYQLVVVEDAFGLAPRKQVTFNAARPVDDPRFALNDGRYAFLSSARKLEEFNLWLDSQIKGKVLALDRGNPFTAKYVSSAYRKGVIRAYTDVNKRKLSKKPGFYMESQSQFLKDAFAQPERLDKVKLLATRSFEGMKGVTAMQKAQMNRILADGMANGRGVKRIAKDMADRVDSLTRSRAMMIARTEIIHAHAEGQLDTFEELGVDELGVMAEWSTAGDDSVCPQCSSLAADGPYNLKEARGMIPAHPNCRCSWIPSFDEPKKKKRKK